MRTRDRGVRSPDRPLPWPRTTLRRGRPRSGSFRARVRRDYLLLVVLIASAFYASWALGQRGPAKIGPHHLPQLGIGAAGRGPVQDAERWARANLPSGARIGVDPHAAHGLGSKPLVVDVLAAGDAQVHQDDFVLSTPTLRADADRASSALRSSLPIATFGTGVARVEVRQVAAHAVATLVRNWRRDLTIRRLAGIALLRNPWVQASESARALLRRGALDLRACALVSLLSARTDVRVVAISRDHHEAVGRPARTLTLSMSAPGTALRQVLATMPHEFRPAPVVALAGGARRLRWDVATAPLPTLE